MKSDGLGLFSNNVSVGGKTLARYISQIYNAVDPTFNARYNAAMTSVKSTIPSSLSGLQVFDRAASAWRKRNMLYCGPVWSLEEKKSGSFDFMVQLKRSFTDIESQNVIIAWAKTYMDKVTPGNNDFNAIQRLKKLEMLQYLASGFPSDMSRFENWKNAVDKQQDYSIKDYAERDRASEQLLGEPTLVIPDAEKIAYARMNGLPNDGKNRPGMYGAAMKLTGLGPKLIRIKLNSIINYLGSPAFVKKELPLEFDGDYTELMAENKKIVLSVLRECTALMNDPNSTKESIQSSDCGVRKAPQF